MNNFFLQPDPLLSQSQQPTPVYIQPEQPMLRDWIGELDRQMKGLDETTADRLNQDASFTELNASLQMTIQNELMNLVRSRLNIQPDVIDNVKKQMEIIKRTSLKTKEDEKKSMSELNDYMKNYSHLSFDEYRKLKQGNETGRTKAKDK